MEKQEKYLMQQRAFIYCLVTIRDFYTLRVQF